MGAAKGPVGGGEAPRPRRHGADDRQGTVLETLLDAELLGSRGHLAVAHDEVSRHALPGHGCRAQAEGLERRSGGLRAVHRRRLCRSLRLWRWVSCDWREWSWHRCVWLGVGVIRTSFCMLFWAGSSALLFSPCHRSPMVSRTVGTGRGKAPIVRAFDHVACMDASPHGFT